MSHLSPPAFLELMGHSLRWEILSLLSESDLRAFELNRQLGQPQNLVSYHLQRLLKTGLVKERRNPADQREIYYSLNLVYLRTAFLASGAALHPLLSVALPTLPPDYAGLSSVRVLFVCTHNSARSQMAEGFWRARVGQTSQVFSAGTQPSHLHPLAVRAMLEMGVDISSQRSKALEAFEDKEFDFVVTVCDLAREACPAFPGDPRYLHWSLADPSEAIGSEAQRLEIFRETAVEISRRVEALLAKIAFGNPVFSQPGEEK